MGKTRQVLAQLTPAPEKGLPKLHLIPRPSLQEPPKPPPTPWGGGKGGKNYNKSSPGGSNILKRRLRGLVRGKA